MLNHHSIIHLIFSLTLTLLQCSFNTLLRVYIIHRLSLNLTLGILLCTVHFIRHHTFYGQVLQISFSYKHYDACIGWL